MGLKLIGEVALDGSGFERGLNSMADSVKGFIAGAFGLYGVEAMIRKTADTAKDLVNQGLRLGLGVEQLQMLKQAAKDGGKELDDLAKMFEKIDVAREHALSGSKEGMKLLARFGQLGISRADLQSQTAAALTMGPIRDKVRTMNPEDLDPILRAFGKGLTELIPVLRTDFEALEKKMRGFGLIMDTETAVKLKSFNDGLEMLSGFMIAQFGPTLVHVLEKIEEAIGAVLGHMDARFHAGDVPEGKPENAGSWGSRAWAFSGKLGAGLIGGVTGLFGLWNEIIGDTEKADERLIQAQGWFKAAGLEGGWLNEAADAMVKNMNEGKPSLKAAWDKMVEDRKKEVAELIERLKHPSKPDFEKVLPGDEKEKKAKEFHERGDALLRVGNFLGSSKSVLEDIGQKQVQLLQQIVNNTRPSVSSGSGYAFSEDNLPNT